MSIFNRFLSSGSWVVTPTGQFPESHILYCWHAVAISAAVPIAIASAPNARAFAKSADTLNPPVIIKEISFLSFSSRNFLALYKANNVGTDVDALTNLGDAPVAPGLPSIVMKSGLD